MELQSNEVFSSLHGEVERLAAELVECRAERDSNVLQCARERREERERVNSQVSSTSQQGYLSVTILHCGDSMEGFTNSIPF